MHHGFQPGGPLTRERFLLCRGYKDLIGGTGRTHMHAWVGRVCIYVDFNIP